MYLAMHEGEPPTGDLHPHTHAHAGRTPGAQADRLASASLRRAGNLAGALGRISPRRKQHISSLWDQVESRSGWRDAPLGYKQFDMENSGSHLLTLKLFVFREVAYGFRDHFSYLYPGVARRHDGRGLWLLSRLVL